MHALRDGVQNWVCLHVLSSWLDLANEDCMRCMNKLSLYSQVHLGDSGWAKPRHTTKVPFTWMTPFLLLSSYKQPLLFINVMEYQVWGKRGIRNLL